MTYGVDTSVVLRFLTGEPVSLAQCVSKRLSGIWRLGGRCKVCDVVLMETYFALQHSYHVSKELAIAALKVLSENPGFEFSDEAIEVLATPNLEKANPGHVDRIIHKSYVSKTAEEIVMLSCEKAAKKLPRVEVITDGNRQ